MKTAPSVELDARQLPRKRRSLEGRPHQSASQTASPHAEKPGGTDPISLARREPASHFALCIYAPHDYVARCSAQLILRNAWAPGLRPYESSPSVPPGLFFETLGLQGFAPTLRGSLGEGRTSSVACGRQLPQRGSLGEDTEFPIRRKLVLLSPVHEGCRGLSSLPGAGRARSYPRTPYPIPPSLRGNNRGRRVVG